jgi:phage terminase large subunit GpA-like protein
MAATRTIDPFPLRLPPRLRTKYAPRERLSLIEWSERHMMLTEGPSVDEGVSIPWSPNLFPLQRAAMEAIEDRRFARLVLMSGPQTWGKTQAVAMPPLLHALLYRNTSAVYVAASKDLAATQWTRKISPAMDADPALAALKPDNTDHAGTKYRRDFTNGTCLHFVGSESIGALSGYTAPVIVCDDVQAYPESVPRFGHPADYAVSRSESFPSDAVRLVFAGTAGTVEDWLWRSLKASAMFCPFVPCLACETYQLIEFDRFDFDHADVDLARANTTMRCAGGECDHAINFEELPQMLERHLWASCPPDEKWVLDPPAGGVTINPDDAAIYPETRRNTSVAGFWCNALYWPFGKTWGERAVDWLEAENDPGKMKTWQQNVAVKPFKEPELDDEALTGHEFEERFGQANGYAARTVPAGVDAITCAVDVQSGYAYYIVRGWNRTTGKSWLIDMKSTRRGSFEKGDKRGLGLALHASFDTIDEMCRVGWPAVGDPTRWVRADRGVIDRGYWGAVISSWHAQRHRGVWKLIWGNSSKGELWPQKISRDSKQNPYYSVDVNLAKSLMRKLLRIPRGEGGHWHLPNEGIRDNSVRAYTRHMTAEECLPTGKWRKKKQRSENHYFDCEVYGLIAAISIGVQFPGHYETKTPTPQEGWFAKGRENRRRR